MTVTAPLAHHLEENGVEFIQFAFRWMNCLLMREMSVKNIVRMWDTYLVRFSVCAAISLADQLRLLPLPSPPALSAELRPKEETLSPNSTSMSASPSS